MPKMSLHSPLGPLTVTENDDVIVSVDWGWARDSIETGLLRLAREQLSDYFDGDRKEFSLPLSPRGTAFQKSVWSFMLGIPYGATETYGGVARAIDSAPRAIGTACGRNPIPIIIPCHRVVGGNGALTGYTGAGGITTKRSLLDLEASLPA